MPVGRKDGKGRGTGVKNKEHGTKKLEGIPKSDFFLAF
jgi:hypothetical protein